VLLALPLTVDKCNSSSTMSPCSVVYIFLALVHPLAACASSYRNTYGQALPAGASTPRRVLAGSLPTPKLANILSMPENIKDPPPLIIKRYWNEGMLQDSVIQSNHRQLFGLIEKLHSGKPITVAAFGTSITNSAGCWFSSIDKMRHSVGLLKAPPKDSMVRCTLRPDGYTNRFMRALNNTWPNPDHVLVNVAVPGATTKYFAQVECLEALLPQKADLMIIEQVVTVLDRREWASIVSMLQ
jgi:hypothetical protein